MTLEDLVPPLELCELIPEGEFSDSVFVWTGLHHNVDYIVQNREFAIWNMIIAPAPTLEEILYQLDNNMDVWKGDNGIWSVFSYLNDDESGMEETSQINVATAALKLWLSVMSEKSDQSERDNP